METTKSEFNTISILAIVFSIPFLGGGLVGLILGIVALKQIQKTGERGKALAWLAIIVCGLELLWWIDFALRFHF